MEDEGKLPARRSLREKTDHDEKVAMLMAKLERAGYGGWDPFDALNSRLFSHSPFAPSRFARLAWTQLCKRSPINFRSIALVTPSANAVTVALAAEVYRRKGEMAKSTRLVKTLLDQQRHFGPAMRAWGYPFAWQAKAFYVPKHAANIIATAYCVRELVHWQGLLPDVESAIIDAARFTAERLMRQAASGSRYVAYVENSDAMVHNASLWGAYVLACGVRLTGDKQWKELAAAAVRHSLAAQRPDGSWPYGEAGHHAFTDGFHTGYVLEALHRTEQLMPGTIDKTRLALGLHYYVQNLFEADGTAKYFADKRYPIDANCGAQAIITIDALGLMGTYRDFSCRVADASLRHLWLADQNRFAYQRGKRYVNRMDYPRWTQIWMALALQIVSDAEASHGELAGQSLTVSAA